MKNLSENEIREIISKQFPTAVYTIDSSDSRWKIRGEISGRYTSHRGILFVTDSHNQQWSYKEDRGMWVKVDSSMREMA